MAEHTDKVIALLTSIDESLKFLVGQAKSRQAAAPKTVATGRDLDGKYGDPVLKFMPRDWTGPSYKNRKFSELPVELLDQVAESLDYFARKAEETNERTSNNKPVAEFRRSDAARARGWAKRIRDGKHTPAAITPAPFAAEADDEHEGGNWATPPAGWD